MTPAVLEQSRSSPEDRDGSGLLAGVNSYHLRMLTESEWNGGAGLSYREIGSMTLDQIWHRLCSLDVLKSKSGQSVKGKPLQVSGQLRTDDEGYIRGRDQDGKPMRARIAGKSLARQLMEQEAERKKQDETKSAREKRREKRRRRRENQDGV